MRASWPALPSPGRTAPRFTPHPTQPRNTCSPPPTNSSAQAGLSHNKALAIRDLAAKTLDGTVPTLARIRRMSDAAIIEHLTQVRGIGVWTVEMFLIFRLGRPDILPVSDYGVRKGFALTFGKLKPQDKVTPCRPAQTGRHARASQKMAGPGAPSPAGISGAPATSQAKSRLPDARPKVATPCHCTGLIRGPNRSLPRSPCMN